MTLKENQYSFSFYTYYEITQVRIVQVASMVNSAGNVVRPTQDAIISAIQDFAARGSLSDPILRTSYSPNPSLCLCYYPVIRYIT